MTYYDILEISPSASAEIIKSAYKALSKKYHPDVYPGDYEEANKRMATINEAYEILSDPAKRKKYDASLVDSYEKVYKENSSEAFSFGQDPAPANTVRSQKSEQQGCAGCLRTIIGIVVWIIIISFAVRSCADTDDKTDTTVTPTQKQEIVVPNDSEESLSEAAHNIERLYFHKPYTDLGTVEIHNFAERNKILEYIVSVGTSKQTLADGCYLSFERKLFGNDYYYATASTTQYYYVGELKSNKPHGMGAIVGFSEGKGTYELQGEVMFYYVGEFKDGMKHGFGVEFNADECDISWTYQDLLGSGAIDQKYHECLCIYLFNHVSYEGYWKENEHNGKGNLYEFPMFEDQYYFSASYTEPLKDYIFGHAYPNITKGEWENGKLSGMISIYKYNRKLYVGEVENGKENGWGTIYYDNGQVKYEGEFKAGKIHGFGSYYDEAGNVVYSGQWDNGDYAH